MMLNKIEEENSLSDHFRLMEAIELFNSKKWYQAHDVFEDIWHETDGPERQLLQAILQVAVAQVHLENRNVNGATILYGEALGRMRKFQLANLGLDIEGLSKCVSKRLELLQVGKGLACSSIPVLNFL